MQVYFGMLEVMLLSFFFQNGISKIIPAPIGLEP